VDFSGEGEEKEKNLKKKLTFFLKVKTLYK
jgi:hypothetical protein